MLHPGSIDVSQWVFRSAGTIGLLRAPVSVMGS
jgi:hypothetical protein